MQIYNQWKYIFKYGHGLATQGGIKDFTLWEPRELTIYFAWDSVIRGYWKCSTVYDELTEKNYLAFNIKLSIKLSLDLFFFHNPIQNEGSKLFPLASKHFCWHEVIFHLTGNIYIGFFWQEIIISFWLETITFDRKSYPLTGNHYIDRK